MRQWRRRPPALLVAATATTAYELRMLFAGEVRFHAVGSHEEAVRAFDRHRPDLVIVGYHFDHARPYRLVHHIRSRPVDEGCPIVLVRLQHVRMGNTTDEQVRDAYRCLGVQEFFGFGEALEGEERQRALSSMRRHVLHLIERNRLAYHADD